MKYLPFLIYVAALTIASSSVMAYENCWDYRKKNDNTGYNACESRNTAESRNETERKEQKERENADRERREAAERNEQNFREKQLDLQRQQLETQKQLDQRQQLETQKQNSYKKNIDEATAFKTFHEMVLTIQGPVNALFKKHINSGNCTAASELAEAVVAASLLEMTFKAKATGSGWNEEVAAKSLLANGMMEFAIMCNKNQTKQKKK